MSLLPRQLPNASVPAVPRSASSLKPLRNGVDERILSTSADIVRQALIGVYPWILESDAVAIEQYCRAEARARILNGHILEICETAGIAKVTPQLWTASINADSVAMKAATSLGLNPTGRLSIAKDAGFATHFRGQQINDLAAEGAKMRKARR